MRGFGRRAYRMRLTFVADMRSPTALQWIRHFVARGYEVQAISSYPVPGNVIAGAETMSLPLVLAGRGQRSVTGLERPEGAHRPSIQAHVAQWMTPRRVAAIRDLFGPALVQAKRGRLNRLIEQHQPDLVHAMRIPFEGMAVRALTGPPVVVSVWGNDFTLHAKRSRIMAKATRRALATAGALHCDCYRDARIAVEWGFDPDRPTWVMPGNGGVNRSVFRPGQSNFHDRLRIPRETILIMNPRGICEYVRTDVFFRALPAVFRTFPDVHVVCPGMAGSRYAENMITGCRLDHSRIHLLPTLEHTVMADIFRSSRVSVSLSEHDGTPNSLLEAMACGALPVVGDVASVREWICNGINGVVVSDLTPVTAAAAIIRALKDDALVQAGREKNGRLIAERADYNNNMLAVESRYEALVKSRSGTAARAN